MRSSIFVLLVLGLVVGLACANDAGSGQDRQEFQRDIESKIDQMEDKLADARERLEELPDESRPEMERQMDNLESQKEDLQEKLDDIQSASADQWEDAKTEIEQASENLESAFADLQSALEEAFSSI
jgi:chromosome segregation ATPase